MRPLIFILLMVMRASLASAWGFTGHYAIGEATWRSLTPKAQAVMSPMLINASLGATSVWADQAKFKKGYGFTRGWHYFDSNTSHPPHDCQLDMSPKAYPNLLTALHSMTIQFVRHQPEAPEHDTKVIDAAFEKRRQQKVFKSRIFADFPTPDKESQQFALFMLSHLLQDLSQPLHLTHVRKAGLEEEIINHRGQKTNLHSYVDVDVVDQVLALHGRGSVSTLISTLTAEAKKRKAGTSKCSLLDLYTWAQRVERYNCDIIWLKPYDKAYHMASTAMGYELLIQAVHMNTCYWENLTDLVPDF